jgi:hypothetical protein
MATNVRGQRSAPNGEEIAMRGIVGSHNIGISSSYTHKHRIFI